MCLKKLLRIFMEKKPVVKTDEERAAAKAMAETTLRQLYDKIKALTENTVGFYHVIEDYFFQDVDFQMIQGTVSQWMADAGRSPECSWDRLLYDKVRQVYDDPLSNRVLHWFDVQNLLSAFQDRVSATSKYLREVFTVIPAYCLYEDTDYSSATRGSDQEIDNIHASINNVFVALSSAFDLFTKVVYECAKYNPQGFDTYKRLKSRSDGILYAKKNCGFDELKEQGLLYDEPACIRTICSFRDEFIHCGSWDYRCAIYYPFIDDNPVEPFIPMPDVEPSGVLVSSGSRNKFYASGTKINTTMPKLVNDVMDVLVKTMVRLEEVLKAKTTPATDKERNEKTMEYMELIAQNALKLPKVVGKRTCRKN